MKLTSWTLALWMGLVFVCGSVVGALGHRLYTVSNVSANVAPRSPDEFRKRFIATMKSRLSATDDQTEKVNAIMDGTRIRFKTTRDSIEPELAKIRDDQAAQIRALLMPSQQSEWDKWRAEREEERKKRAATSGQ